MSFLNNFNSEDFYNNYVLMFFSAFSWILAYQLCTLKYPYKSPEYCCRVVTLMHGTTATLLSITCILLSKYFQCYRITQMVKTLTLANSFGYFFFDMNWILWTKNTEAPLMYFHHLMSLYALTVYMFKTESMDMATTSLGMLEISNPFQQLRWLLRDDGKMKTHYILFHTVEVIFFILFLLMRVFIGTYALFWYITYSHSDLHDKITCIIGYTVGLLFSRQLLLYMKSHMN